MQLQPYLYFYGRCEEALAFYKGVFGGGYELRRVGDSPMAQQAPPEAHNRVMHASFEGPGFTFMCSDGQDTKAVDPDAGNVSLMVSAGDRAEGERVFNRLADGGTIRVPFAEAFWGGTFGVVTDKFGTEWQVGAP